MALFLLLLPELSPPPEKPRVLVVRPPGPGGVNPGLASTAQDMPASAAIGPPAQHPTLAAHPEAAVAWAPSLVTHLVPQLLTYYASRHMTPSRPLQRVVTPVPVHGRVSAAHVIGHDPATHGPFFSRSSLFIACDSLGLRYIASQTSAVPSCWVCDRDQHLLI